jgi:Kdo2-lipid IVA lauroyltransferase/acyltransferase
VLRALAVLVGWLPWAALDPLGRWLGWLAGSLLRIRRAHVEDAMRRAGVASPSRTARAMYASLGRSAFEFLWLARRGDEAVGHVTVDGASAVAWREARAQGRGVVIAASHTGNWDLAACAMARDVALLVVTKRLSARSIDRFWQATRAGRGVSLAGADGAMASGREALARGGAVAMMIDQVPVAARHAVEVDFLGVPALADRAPAALAAAAGAPLVVAAARRDGRGGHELHVLRVITPPPRPTRAWIAEATVSATQALDAFVRANPSQWLWMHRRWKKAPRFAVDRAARGATLASPWSKIPSSLPGEASKAG